jgi:hypothetical protein
MNIDEFQTWLFRHRAACPGFSQWLDNLGSDQPDRPGTESTKKAAQVQFREITLESAEKVTRKIRDGLLPAKWPSEHFQIVYLTAKETDNDAKADRKGLDCPKCRDMLWVEILDRGALKHAAKGKLKEAVEWWRERRKLPNRYPTNYVYCDCERGKFQAKHDNNQNHSEVVEETDVLFVSRPPSSMSLDEFVSYCEEQVFGGFGDFYAFS